MSKKMKRIFTNEDINKLKGNIKLLHIAYKEKVKKNKKLKKELKDLRKSFKEACRCCDRVKEKELNG